MKGKRTLMGVVTAVLAMVLAVSLTSAQGPGTPLGGAPEGGDAVDAVGAIVPIQGRLTSASGVPLNGNYSIRASLYDVPSGGTELCSDTRTVSVTNGLFKMDIRNCTSAAFNGQQLYLGIKVGADDEMTPRQAIYPVPYAWSLRPGARIVDSKDFPDFILQVQNTGSGRAIQASTNGHTAIEGWNGNAAAGKWGVWGGSANGIGVEGTSEGTNGIGVKGKSQGTSGFGVFGYASATTGTTYGVAGQSDSPSGRGVNGYASANTGTNFGVYGETRSTSGYGVAGFQTGYSTGDNTAAASGGLFGGRNGVIGITKENGGYGVAGYDKSTSGGAGVRGQTYAANGWAGSFYSDVGNGVYVSAPAGKTGLNVAGGTKNAVVRAEGGSRLLYTEESTEVWFTDYGFGRLQNGVAVIAVDPLFAQTVNLNEPYHVFVQPYGDANLYVANRTPTGFEVRLHDGDPNAEFSYRIVAKRLGYETTRLERAPWADNDPNLYPERGATWEAEQGGAP